MKVHRVSPAQGSSSHLTTGPVTVLAGAGQDRFEALLQYAPHVVSLCDGRGRLGYVNDTVVRVMGYEPAELCGRDLRDLVHPEDREVAGALIDRVRTADAEVELRAEMRMRHADDSLHWHEVVVRNLLSDPRVSSILCHLRDVTEARAAYEQIAHAATHDGLTGLVNRAVFDRDLERALAHSRRYGHGVAVLFCDLDGFKAINDGHGHHAGDRLLASVGASIARNTRACDTVARLGGDEFAVVLTRVNDADDALGVARRIIAGISLDPTVVHTKPAVGCSVGVAFTSGSSSGVDAPTLLQRADAAMYQAKRRRRNAAHLHS